MQLGLPLSETPVTEAVSAPVAARPGQAPLTGLRYYVRHRRARRYVLRVDADGRVRVTIPRGGSRREADAFADRNASWVEDRLARLHATAPRPFSENPAARARAKQELPAILAAWADTLGLRVASTSIRNQRTRWGSCGRKGDISLNWRLVLMPEWVRDYVIVHELMHLRRMDHSPRFWALVSAAYPRYREARAWLREHGSALR